MGQTAQQRLLKYARDRLGIAEIAARMEVSEEVVERWMRHEERISCESVEHPARRSASFKRAPLRGGSYRENFLVDTFPNEIPVIVLPVYERKDAPVDVGNTVDAGEMTCSRGSALKALPRDHDLRFSVEPEKLHTLDAPGVRKMDRDDVSGSLHSDRFTFQNEGSERPLGDLCAAYVLKMKMEGQRLAARALVA